METYQGSCHCGNVKFEIDWAADFVVQCNCSICARKNAKMALVPETQFKLIEGEEEVSMYQFNKKLAKHYFCKTCGIYTHHRPRTKPDFYGINTGCLEGVDLSEVSLKEANGQALD